MGVMRKTLYGHFMGGDTRERVLACVEGNAKFGIQPMIAFTAAETHGITDRRYADCVGTVLVEP